MEISQQVRAVDALFLLSVVGLFRFHAALVFCLPPAGGVTGVHGLDGGVIDVFHQRRAAFLQGPLEKRRIVFP